MNIGCTWNRILFIFKGEIGALIYNSLSSHTYLLLIGTEVLFFLLVYFDIIVLKETFARQINLLDVLFRLYRFDS